MKNEIYNIEERTCNFGNITLRSDEILTFKPFDTVTSVSLTDIEEMFSIFIEITKGVPHLYYSEYSKAIDIDSVTKAFVTEKMHHLAKAAAVKENSAMVRFLTHSYIYLNRPKVTIKMFKTEEESISWLKSLDI